MKAKELTIGDWVLMDLNYSEEEPMYAQLNYQPYKIQNGEDIDLACETNCIGDADVYQPIPLTREILEKNGFVNDFYEDETIADNGAAITFQGYSYHDDGILVTYCNETIHATNDYTDAYIAIRGTSVSLLQHVMRLCGIDKEITL